jgi:hypothetical protein
MVVRDVFRRLGTIFTLCGGRHDSELGEDRQEAIVDVGVGKAKAPVWWKAKAIVEVAKPAAQTKRL